MSIRLTEAGHQGWSDRQFEPEPLDAYNNQASRDGGYLSYSEGGPLSRIEPFRPFQAPTNRSTETPYRSSQPDYRRRQWDGRGIPEGWGLQEAGEERGGHYAQSGYSTANERSEKDNYRHGTAEPSSTSLVIADKFTLVDFLSLNCLSFCSFLFFPVADLIL